MQQICIFVGARPNFIKVAPLIRAIQQCTDINYQLVYAGCHTDPTLEPSLFADLQIPHPDFYLEVDNENLNELTGQVMSAFDAYLSRQVTDTVLVVDDLASTMAAAIVTKKHGIRLAHLVAGTRSFDINMPKEINRLVIDGLSDLLFTAGTGSNSIVTREGAEMNKIYMVGNILIDTLRQNHQRWCRPAFLDETGARYLLLTINRKALLADEQRLSQLLRPLVDVTSELPVITPLRDSAREVVQRIAPQLTIVSPCSYLEFGYLASHAGGVITDSGNVAEEATFNRVPCITLNSYTEHIETVKIGSNLLVGENPAMLRDALGDMLHGRWKTSALPDRWDGRTAERIVQILREINIR